MKKDDLLPVEQNDVRSVVQKLSLLSTTNVEKKIVNHAIALIQAQERLISDLRNEIVVERIKSLENDVVATHLIDMTPHHRAFGE